MEFHIVDDEQHVSTIISTMLKTLGYHSRVFNCPCEYIDYAASSDFNLPIATLTDIRMPGVNGYEMIDEVSSLHPDMKFVVISASPDLQHPAMKKACLFIIKPFRMATLSKLTTSLIQCKERPKQPSRNCMEVNEHRLFLTEWNCPHCRS